MMTKLEIAPAIIRLYGRAREIECEVEQAIDASEPVEVLLERCERDRQRYEKFERTGNYEDGPDQGELAKAKIRAAALAENREYRWTRAEIGRLLELGPADINPLDLDPERRGDGTDVGAWRRAIVLRTQLNRNLLCWLRPGSRRDLAIVDLDDAG